MDCFLSEINSASSFKFRVGGVRAHFLQSIPFSIFSIRPYSASDDSVHDSVSEVKTVSDSTTQAESVSSNASIYSSVPSLYVLCFLSGIIVTLIASVLLNKCRKFHQLKKPENQGLNQLNQVYFYCYFDSDDS